MPTVEVVALPDNWPVEVLNNNPAGTAGVIPNTYGGYPLAAVTGVTGVMITPFINVLVATTDVIANISGDTLI